MPGPCTFYTIQQKGSDHTEKIDPERKGNDAKFRFLKKKFCQDKLNSIRNYHDEYV